MRRSSLSVPTLLCGLALLFGGGVEYLLEPNLAVTGKIKLGPTFGTNGFPTSFTLYLLAGAAYKF